MPEWMSWLGGEFIEVDVVGRLLLATLLGAIIGTERERSQKAAGLRTNILICLGAALVMEVSRSVARATGSGADPTRMPAQVISGIGFIGAGTILVARGRVVVGLTTAATIWVVAAVGIAVGAEAYTHAIVGTILMGVVLSGVARIEDYFFPQIETVLVEIELEPKPGVVEHVTNAIGKTGLKTRLVEVEKDSKRVRVLLETRGVGVNRNELLAKLCDEADVRQANLPGAGSAG